ncbi:hypothetical protein C8R46DRAFT_1035041 [Mycena filopes]|nr:hypothetical protein C8R46DRAFT_1035041 [Mycena filopes]
MLIAVSLLAIISGAASSYMPDNTAGLMIWQGKDIPDIKRGYIVQQNRLCYDETRGFYLSMDPTQRSLEDDAKASQAIYVDRSDDIQNARVYTISTFDAKNVKQTMAVDKPAMPGAPVYGFTRGPNNIDHDESNTIYRYGLWTNKCEQQPRRGNIYCTVHVSSSTHQQFESLHPRPRPQIVSAGREDGTCAFMPRDQGNEDRSFDWSMNVRGDSIADEDAAAQQDLAADSRNDAQIGAASEADGGGDGGETTPPTDGTTAMNRTSNTGDGAEGTSDAA